MSVPYWAAKDMPKKAEPVRAMIQGVAAAATPQPRYWKTNLPVSMSPIVTLPVAIDTSARTPCRTSRPFACTHAARLSRQRDADLLDRLQHQGFAFLSQNIPIAALCNDVMFVCCCLLRLNVAACGQASGERMGKLWAECRLPCETCWKTYWGHIDQQCHDHAADALLRIFTPLCRTDLSQGNIHQGCFDLG